MWLIKNRYVQTSVQRGRRGYCLINKIFFVKYLIKAFRGDILFTIYFATAVCIIRYPHCVETHKT